MTDQQKPHEVLGITEADFHSWKHTPVTKAVIQYMHDYAEALKRDHLARWEACELDDKLECEAIGRVATLSEIADLRFSHLALFYEEPQEEEDDTHEATSL